ncbi:hypothetical protein HML84_11195 [Alcanivorax sp. IO_7]|nr:hypothetical protein HML84_11195 [Alcanivorax sp. IO_7]
MNSTDPATVTSVNYTESNLVQNSERLLGDVDSSSGLPQTEDVFGIPVSDPTDPDPNSCVQVINPSAQLNQGYPIAAVTNLLGYTANNADPQALRALVREVVAGNSALPTGFVRLGTASKIDSLINTCIN